VNEPVPIHEVDALDWLHEQGKRYARSLPEFDVDGTLAVVREVADAPRPAAPPQSTATRAIVGRPDGGPAAAANDGSPDLGVLSC
jgi:hypothetical protein